MVRPWVGWLGYGVFLWFGVFGVWFGFLFLGVSVVGVDLGLGLLMDWWNFGFAGHSVFLRVGII